MVCRAKGRIVVCVLVTFCCAFSPQPTRDSLREVAQHSHILIGAAVRPAQLSEKAYAETLAHEFDMLEPEDALKWEVLRPGPQSFDFSEADKVVDFALRHDMKVRGHTLVWHRQNPPWLDGNYSTEQLSHLLETHIKTVVAHYRGKVFTWDVANEAFDEIHPGKLRSTLWYNQPGIGYSGQDSEYLAQCFRWAHEADPQALLFYNEAEVDELSPKSDAVYAMVRDFRRRGVPIAGVGLQMHIASLHPNVASISANIARFTQLGLQVHITEMDVSLPVNERGEATAEDLRQQADVYASIVAACLSHPGCTAIQTWGFTDKYSWIGSHSKHTRGSALLFDRDYRPKPAYDALRRALAGANQGTKPTASR